MLAGFRGILLDVGCGDATMIKRIKEALGCEVMGVDLVRENVAKAKRKGIDAKMVDLNNEKLPFEAGSFDAIFAGEVIEHIIDSEGLLSEMRRVLKKDGTLILTVPNIACWYNRFLIMFGYLPHHVESGSKKPYGTPWGEINGHVKAFTKRSIVEMVNGNGFRVQKVEGSGFSNSFIKKYKGKGTRFAPLFFLAERVISKRSGLATNIIIKAVKE